MPTPTPPDKCKGSEKDMDHPFVKSTEEQPPSDNSHDTMKRGERKSRKQLPNTALLKSRNIGQLVVENNLFNNQPNNTKTRSETTNTNSNRTRSFFGEEDPSSTNTDITQLEEMYYFLDGWTLLSCGKGYDRAEELRQQYNTSHIVVFQANADANNNSIQQEQTTKSTGRTLKERKQQQRQQLQQLQEEKEAQINEDNHEIPGSDGLEGNSNKKLLRKNTSLLFNREVADVQESAWWDRKYNLNRAEINAVAMDLSDDDSSGSELDEQLIDVPVRRNQQKRQQKHLHASSDDDDDDDDDNDEEDDEEDDDEDDDEEDVFDDSDVDDAT
eukprot:m.229807 g.229807  ORF g.229807 m.229807 type:complete len:328 (+) comp13887_c0_seq2:732-1715(+)